MKAIMLRSIGRLNSALQRSAATVFFCGIYFDFIFILPNFESRKKNKTIAPALIKIMVSARKFFVFDMISIIIVAVRLFTK